MSGGGPLNAVARPLEDLGRGNRGNRVKENGLAAHDSDIARRRVGEQHLGPPVEKCILADLCKPIQGHDLADGFHRRILAAELRLADADPWKPAFPLRQKEPFEAGLIFGDGVEDPPALEIEKRIRIAGAVEMLPGQFGIVREK